VKLKEYFAGNENHLTFVRPFSDDTRAKQRCNYIRNRYVGTLVTKVILEQSSALAGGINTARELLMTSEINLKTTQTSLSICWDETSNIPSTATAI
jgi:hypothetical protein